MFHRHQTADLTGLPFDEHTVAAFAGRISVIQVPAGTQLCRQGRQRAEIIWLLEGEADVIRNGVTIAHVGAGTVVGEINATRKMPYQTADVITTTSAVLGVQNQREWLGVAHDVPAVADHVARLAESRLAAQRN